MLSSPKLKQLTLLIGDAAVFYAALYATLFLRYGNTRAAQSHIGPFTIIFALWIIVFYIVGLYELRDLAERNSFLKRFGIALSVNFITATFFFYFIPLSSITPKINLFFFAAVFAAIEYPWRAFYHNFLRRRSPRKRVLVIGDSAIAKETLDYLKQQPQLGYEVRRWIRGELTELSKLNAISFSKLITEHKATIVAVPARLKKHPHIAQLLYANLGLGIEIIDLATLYEICFQKVPLSELEEIWFLENVTQRHELYDILKRPFELFLAAALGIALLPLGIIIIAVIKFTSSGSTFFSQRRIGMHGHSFTLWKFRTMRTDAECNGPVWAKPNDNRVTVIGRFLRQTHLDELPQLWNIFHGDLSFVGPRPERPEFTKRLAGQIPFYELRHLVRPGLTGWAQINYRYGASTADAYEKQQYDIFYLKHRSFWLDFLILLKTARRFVTSA